MNPPPYTPPKVWKRKELQQSQMAHDAYSCEKFPNSRPFPTQRPPDYQHVGQASLARPASFPTHMSHQMFYTFCIHLAGIVWGGGGQVFLGDGRPRMPDVTDFMLGKEAPQACRRHVTWRHG